MINDVDTPADKLFPEISFALFNLAIDHNSTTCDEYFTGVPEPLCWRFFNRVARNPMLLTNNGVLAYFIEMLEWLDAKHNGYEIGLEMGFTLWYNLKHKILPNLFGKNRRILSLVLNSCEEKVS